MDLLGVPQFVALIVYFVLLAIKLFAFVNSLLWSGEHYRVAGKWTKAGWASVTGASVVLQVLTWVPGVVNLALTIAALVYLADVRPAMAGLKRR